MRVAVLFDNGGTLTEDPFDTALVALRRDCHNGKLDLPFGTEDAETFFSYWDWGNRHTDIPSCSHYLQEELWPARALLRLDGERKLGLAPAIPLLVPRLLERYRAVALRLIQRQSQWPVYRETLEWLKELGIH